jgi:drug/metabolite transporter (DMT)-like permease
VLRRAARRGSIDPRSFTALRLASGAAILLPAVGLIEKPARPTGSWTSAGALFGYAIAFSLAYVSLETGTGALILFGAVQATMIGAGISSGERLRAAQVLGLVLAMGGLVVLCAPGISAPRPAGAIAMAAAGCAWGVYSLRGRGQPRPVAGTAGNPARRARGGRGPGPRLARLGPAPREPAGAFLAILSGLRLRNGIRRLVMALRELSAATAGIVQLAVPVLAATAGSSSSASAGPVFRRRAMILGGIGLAVLARGRGRGRTLWVTNSNPEMRGTPEEAQG